MPLQSIQDSLVLDIYCKYLKHLCQNSIFMLTLDKPLITLHHGHGIDEENINEGSDVYLECKVGSRPETDNVVWIKDVGC